VNTLAYILILSAILIIRAVSKGRVLNISEDLSDAFLAFINGETDELSAVLARTGDSNKASAGVANETGVVGGTAPEAGTLNQSILSNTLALGKAAKGYLLTATGPNYYDCSGLVWRALQKVGYKGGRFTTSTIQGTGAFTKVSTPIPGDIVLWPRHHMGVVTSPGRFYSARNVRAGITEATIKGFRNESPIYLRYTPKIFSVKPL
jgi:hypothetical protein